MTDTPLGRARQALLDAKQRVVLKDTPTHRQDVRDARAHLDYLLDTIPTSIPPTTQEPIPPGSSVSYAYSKDERVLSLGEEILALQDGEQ